MNTDKYYLIEQGFSYPSFKIKRENPNLYKEQKDDYNRRMNELNELFKNDLLEDVGLENHPFRDKIFAYAWSEWHSGGYSEIASHFVELADLIKSVSEVKE